MPRSTDDHAVPIDVLLRVVCSRDATCREVLLRGASDTSWGEVRDQLSDRLGLPAAVYAGAARLTDDLPLGELPLIHGVQLADRPSTSSPPHLLQLVVAEGPDCGQVHALREPVLRIGRGSCNGLPIADPLLSRAHAAVHLSHGRVEVIDLSSVNGTSINELVLSPGVFAELRVGDRLTVGGTTLRLQVAAPRRSPTINGGRVQVHRAPRDPITLPTVVLEPPQPPAPAERRSLPWLMMLLPMPISLVLALAFHSVFLVAFGLMSPVMMLGQHLHDRRSGGRTQRRLVADYEVRRAQVGQQTVEATAAAVALRRRLAPDAAELRGLVASGRIWPRRPDDADYLWWRVGTGDVAVGVSLRGVGSPPVDHLARDGPVTVSLAEHPIVGVSGPPTLRRTALEHLLGQLALLHSPAFLRVLIVATRPQARAAWDWARWLPHLLADGAPLGVLVVGADDGLITDLLTPLGAPSDGHHPQDRHPPHTLVVLDGARDLTRHPVVADVLRHGESNGVAVVAVDALVDDLPSECSVTVELASVSQGALHGAVQSAFWPDLPAPGWARAVAESVIPLTDATPSSTGSDPPSAARLLDVLPMDATNPDRVLAGWAERRRSTRAVLGLGSDGLVTIDLASDGPHALVGGTTGAGKSELLQTLIASLSIVNRPDEMVFVLVDYKGGAAFKDCARLPHTVGLVTDLDAHLTRRALRSLEAEIRRRETVLGGVGAKDLDDYQRHPGSTAAPLPRLVLIIDEFRVLAEELPEFIAGVVRLAAVGRSLGIHLVLATQRPAGVITSDIRANVSLRIALRVRDIGDSDDVIEAPDAARISARTPGRAILRAGSGPTTVFQTARVGGRAPAHGDHLSLVEVDPRTGRLHHDPAATTPAHDAAPTDLQRLVAASRAAAAALAAAPVRFPWLPTLPELCTVDRLTGPCRRLGHLTTDDVAGLGLLTGRLGLIDLPDEQRQDALVWCLDDGHLAIVGGPRSGCTSATRSVVVDLAARVGADDLHVYVFDPDGSLRVLAAFGHTGAVIGRDDVAVGVRLVDWLVAEIARRHALLAAAHHSDLTGYRREAADHAAAPAHLLVVIDGWDVFTDDYELVEGGRAVDGLQQVLRDGVSAGIHVLLTGGRGLLSSRVASLVPHRLCLRMADEMDLVLAGVRPSQVPARMPPGRALLLPEGHEVQLALLVADPSGPAQAARATTLGAASAPASRMLPSRFVGLPDSVDLEQISSAEEVGQRDHGRAHGLILGLGGDDAGVLRVWQEPSVSRSLIICGPPRSGRTTALLTLVHQLLEVGPVIWVAGAAAPPDLPGGVVVLPWEDADAIRHAVLSHPAAALVIDDLEQVLSDPVEDLALEHLRRCRDGALLVAGSTAELGADYRGVAHELRRQQRGVLLQPERHDGEVLGTRVPDVRRRRPGRGVLVIRGQTTELQVARYPRGVS